MDPVGGGSALAIDPVETRVVLRCDGGYLGEVINHRWLRLPCRKGRCRADGMQTVHTIDLLTGQRSTDHLPTDPPGVLPGQRPSPGVLPG